ncbi:hypothetical protein HDV03_000101 [Kappamyces sp. JEL0829]|nr:hypothetical protein HDV03_000101 [Kappamyces sp. JEL0829]
MSQVTPQQQSPTRAAEVQQQVQEVIGIMHTNIDKVVQRGEKLDALQNKTEELQQGALSFKKTSGVVKDHMWWKDMKLTVIIVAIVAVIVTVGVVTAVQVVPGASAIAS